MKKKLLTILLSVFIVMTSFATSVFAEDIDIGNIIYGITSETDKTVKIRSTAAPKGEIEIPEKIEHGGTNYTVTSIDDAAFMSCDEITKLTLPESITTIGELAFGGCPGLVTLILKSATPPALGNDAFANCNANLKIYVPANKVEDYKTAWAAYAGKIEAIPAPHDLTVTKANGEEAVEDSDYQWNFDYLNIKKSGLVVSGTSTKENITVQKDITDLTLSNVNITGKSPLTILGNGAFDLIIAKDSNNTLTGAAIDVGDYCASIETSKSLNIKGSGTLNIKQKEYNATNVPFVGIFAYNQLTIDGPTINIEVAGTLNESSAGIASNGHGLTLNSGNVSIKSGESTDKGIGIFVFDNAAITVNGGSLTVQGKTKAMTTAPKGMVLVASTNYTGSPLATYDKTDIDTYKYLKVEKEVTVADILKTVEGGFPTVQDDGWVNENGQRAYINGDIINFSTSISLNEAVQKDGNNYKYSNRIVDCTFVMTSEKLTSIIVSGALIQGYNGEYVPQTNYVITDGKQATINIDDNKDVVFKSNADFSKFVRVEVDNTTVDSSNYIASEGSTKVTMKAAYLSNLALGEHTLIIISKDGKASTTFTITKASKPSPTPYIPPKTGVR